MQEQTSLIIITHNNRFCIDLSYKRLKDYFRFHHFITETIIVDNNSTDGTKEYLQNYNPLGFKIIFFDNELSEKKCLITALEACSNENIIIIEPELHHRLSEFSKVCQKLRKVSLVLPNRFDHRGKCDKVTDNLIKGFVSELFTGYVCKDPYNAFKGLKRASLLPIIRLCRSEHFVWLEAIKTARKEGLRITEPPTYYKERVFYKENVIMKNIKELIKIKKIK